MTKQTGSFGANVTASVYKGKYYQVQVYTDVDMDLYVDSPYEWDINDRIGIRIQPEDIELERIEPNEEEA